MQLTIKIAGQGTVKVGAGKTHTRAFSVTVLKGRPVTLLAMSDQGWQFSRWIGCTTKPHCTLTMSTAKTVTALFHRKT